MVSPRVAGVRKVEGKVGRVPAIKVYRGSRFKAPHILNLGGPGSVVGRATGYRLDGPGLGSRWGRGFAHLSRQALGPT